MSSNWRASNHPSSFVVSALSGVVGAARDPVLDADDQLPVPAASGASSSRAAVFSKSVFQPTCDGAVVQDLIDDGIAADPTCGGFPLASNLARVDEVMRDVHPRMPLP
jgi:hypothetical protein